MRTSMMSASNTCNPRAGPDKFGVQGSALICKDPRLGDVRHLAAQQLHHGGSLRRAPSQGVRRLQLVRCLHLQHPTMRTVSLGLLPGCQG